MRRVYLDHNATTPLRPEAREAYLEVLDGGARNPSSVHASGRRARALLDDARERIAGALGVLEDEIVFTSGGTEADNTALFGAVRAAGPGATLVTTAVEHSAVLGAASHLEDHGHAVIRVGVDPQGRPDLEQIARASVGAALVSVAAANNELGTTVDLERLRSLIDRRGTAERPFIHTDAVQMLGRLPIDLAKWGVDLACFSAHKVGGPTGVGILVVRGSVPIVPLLHGGGQEAKLRPGTENLAAIVAAARAMERAVLEREEFAARTGRLTRILWAGIEENLAGARLLGPAIDSPERLPNTLNVSLPDVDGRTLVTRLDLEGLEVSAGSACASGSLEPSHVLRAIGLDERAARAGLRMSFGWTSTVEDAQRAVEILSTTLGKTP